MKVTPFECYKTYVAMKQHFTKDKYDYFKYGGKSRASATSFKGRKDRYFFERMSRKKSDEQIVQYFISNFVSTEDPSKVWIGEIIQMEKPTSRTGKKEINRSLTYSEMKLNESLKGVVSTVTSILVDNIRKSSKNT